MPKIIFTILIGLVALAGIIVLGLCLFVVHDIKRSAKVETSEQVASPKGDYLATIFVYHTGGLDSYPFTYVNLRKSGTEFDPIQYENWFSTTFKKNTGNVIELDGKFSSLSIVWVDNQTLRVVFPREFKNEKIDWKLDEWNDVKIVYQNVEETQRVSGHH